MRAFLLALCLVAPLAVYAGSWSVSPFSETIMMDINMVSPTVGFVAGAQNGEGANILKTTDGAQTFQELPMANAYMLMAGAAYSETSAIVSGLGILQGSVQYTTDGKTFTNASEPKIAMEATQAAYTIGGTEGLGYAIVGQWNILGDNQTYNGVGVSADAGASFSVIDSGNMFPARYGAFPSPSNWFLTFGEWPNTTETFGRPITRNIHMHTHGTKGCSIHHIGKHRPSLETDDGQWIGQIMASTDGGATWTLQFSNDTFYFNQIACASESVCFAVGENDEQAFVYRTTNAGASWEEIYVLNGVSLMSVEVLSEEEVWIGGGVLSFPVVGHTYHSVDGGNTWESFLIQDNYVTSFSWPSADAGFGTSIDTEQQSGIVVWKA